MCFHHKCAPTIQHVFWSTTSSISFLLALVWTLPAIGYISPLLRDNSHETLPERLSVLVQIFELCLHSSMWKSSLESPWMFSPQNQGMFWFRKPAWFGRDMLGRECVSAFCISLNRSKISDEADNLCKAHRAWPYRRRWWARFRSTALTWSYARVLPFLLSSMLIFFR